jgi:hypothetical protein
MGGVAIIGAAAFADIVSPWWVSLNDRSAVPYGATGGDHTENYKLIHFHGRRMDSAINRYLALSVVCILVWAPIYLREIKRAAKAVEMRRQSATSDLEGTQ